MSTTIPAPAPSAQTVVTITHLHADPSHPEHHSFLAKLGVGLLKTGVPIAVLVATGGVVRIGGLAGHHFDIETGGMVPDGQ